MSLTILAEILAGETLMSYAGPVDAETASAADQHLWPSGISELPAVASEPIVQVVGAASILAERVLALAR